MCHYMFGDYKFSLARHQLQCLCIVYVNIGTAKQGLNNLINYNYNQFWDEWKYLIWSFGLL